jgi:photosystem II stability/assembly factor-like uncharacterized protein
VTWTSPRGRRALKLIGVAVLAVATTALVYLRPSLAPARSAGSVSPTPKTTYVTQILDASFGDADHGAVVMVGEFQTVASYITSNGGHTWTRRAPGPVQTRFFDRDHAVAVDGRVPEFWITTDAGRTWNFGLLPTAGQLNSITPTGIVFHGMSFLDPLHWWRFGLELRGPAPNVVLWQTSDAGHTWTQLAPTGLPPDAILDSPVFTDALHGAILAWAGENAWPSIFATQDGGTTWRSIVISDPGTQGARQAWPGSVEAALITHAGRMVISINATGVASPGAWSSVSNDGGVSWTSWTPEPAGAGGNLVCFRIGASGARQYCRGLATPIFDDAGHLLVIGDRSLWTSSDLGLTWQARSLRLPPKAQPIGLVAANGANLFLKARRPGSQSLPLVVDVDMFGPLSQMLLRSRDGGVHWSAIPLP